MSEGKILSATINRIGEVVIELTKDGTNEDPFWESSDKHFMSVIGLYIAKEKKLNQFRDIIKEAHSLLKDCDGWISLSETLLSTNDPEFKNYLLNDALFHTSKGWEREEERRKHMVLSSVKKRLNQLIQQLE